MTTTGGPEHSVAEPVTEEHLDGDDIVVVPDGARPHHGRSRALVIGAVVVLLLAAGIGIAIATTRHDNPSTVRTVTPPARVPARTPAPHRPVTHTPKTVHRRTPAPVAPHTPVSSPPVAIAPPPAPPPVAPTEPPATSPPAEPTSVLQWTASPAAVTVKSGGHAPLTVHVLNPTDGTVTLGNPLSCAPVLRGPQGHVIGFGVCVEMAQVMSPHDALTQRYTIWATDSAAAGGAPLKPGNYTARIDNLFDVKVTITAP